MTPDPNDSDKAAWILQAIPLVLMSMLAGMGGAVRYLSRIDRQGIPFRFTNFLIEIFVSAFTGIVVFMLCDAAGWGWEYTAAVVAVSGHMGARAWYLAEDAVIEPLLRRYGYDDRQREIERQKEENR
jgi:hypothetical protein